MSKDIFPSLTATTGLNLDARSCAEYVGKTIHRAAGAKYCYTYHGQEILPAFSEGWIDNVLWNKLYRAECFDWMRCLRWKRTEFYITIVAIQC